MAEEAGRQDTGRGWGTILLFTVIGLIVGGLIGRFTSPSQHGAPISVLTPAPAQTVSLAPVRVYVCGAVQQPGVYELPAGSIAEDALSAAGGPTQEADLEALNLALEVRDQQQVRVPRAGESVALELPERSAPVGQLNINTATAAELEALPRIGPTIAENIIAYREAHGPFRSVDDLLEVPLIGPTTLEALKDLVTVR